MRAKANTLDTRAKLLHVLVAYDQRQSKKPGHNRYALAHYMNALAYVMRCIEAGFSVRLALCDAFTGRLLDLCLKAVGEAKATDFELRGNLCRVLLPSTVDEAEGC